MYQPIIEIDNIPVYQKNILILSNVSFQIFPGEHVYLIGRTGSGKSSLLKTLYADIPVMDGHAIVAGYDLRKLKNKEVPYLRRKLGIIFQDFQLLMDRSVNENLIFLMKASGWKDKREMQDQLQDVLVKVGLGTKGFKMPNQLSGGEQQRVAIARALINNPEVIIADEPTGNLDPETSFGIVRLLKEISESGKSVLMATHNYSLIEKYPSRILKCEDGRVYSST
ncbi:MAG: ATP-binding cassette domain-containing protein [Bacteroidetes bacterium]|nr:ATP-binding cassette domain-containing protein [Bacteroidota bacterium]